MNRLDALNESQIKSLVRWLIFKQMDFGEVSGFVGRPNKRMDSCYSFWVCSTLKLLDSFDFIGKRENINWILSCQCFSGGFSSDPDSAKGMILSLATRFYLVDVDESFE